VTPSAEEISSRRFGGWPISLPTSGPTGVSAFISGTGIARFGALRPVAWATVSIASRIVVALQTIVSREISPFDPAVITVGSFHAGSKHNIISDRAHLQLTVRAYSDAVHEHLLAGIERIARAEAEAAMAPQPPTVTASQGTPPTINDPGLTGRLAGRLAADLGADRVIDYNAGDFVEIVREMGGADVILDIVGGPYIERNIKAARHDGRIVQLAFNLGSKVEINLMPVMLKRLIFTGSTLRSRPAAFKTEVARQLREKVWPLIEDGTIVPVVRQTLPLTEAAEAHRLMETAGHMGKIVLTVG